MLALVPVAIILVCQNVLERLCTRVCLCVHVSPHPYKEDLIYAILNTTRLVNSPKLLG